MHEARGGCSSNSRNTPQQIEGSWPSPWQSIDEARAAGALNHPNIVAVYDVGEQGGEAFIVTELLDGETLRGLLFRRKLSTAEALDLAIQLAEGPPPRTTRGSSTAT